MFCQSACVPAVKLKNLVTYDLQNSKFNQYIHVFNNLCLFIVLQSIDHSLETFF
jgi:hypothetical protein